MDNVLGCIIEISLSTLVMVSSKRQQQIVLNFCLDICAYTVQLHYNFELFGMGWAMQRLVVDSTFYREEFTVIPFT